jgi:hypothetical protein
MLLMFLAACAGPEFGTWLFTKEVTLPDGTECLGDVQHNFVGAYEPIATGDDPSWTDTSTAEVSPELFFGRLEQTADGAALIVGTELLPGERRDDGSWLFYWTGSDSGRDDLTHVTGYAYAYTFDTASTLRVQGTFEGGTFTGAWESEYSDIDAWTESDTWSDEAAAIVGSTGEIPAADHLLRLDATTGAEAAATNTQAAYDCGEAGCTLTVTESCAYRYTLTGISTEFEPGDSRWVEDAGQAAGN